MKPDIIKATKETVRGAIRDRIPNDVHEGLRKRFGTPRPWDPGVVLEPPSVPAGELVGAPDFVGVGTQKSGTSWWYNVIATHTSVHDVAEAHKERHFFSSYFSMPFTSADVERYHRWFPRPPGAIVGEWTPQYMHQPWVPGLLAKAAPDAKILVLLRDPIERYRSGLTHYQARGGEVHTALAVDAFERGLYAQQLERLYRFFPKEQVLVLQYEVCRLAPTAAAARTFDFLGLEPQEVTMGIESRVNTTEIEKVPVPDHMRAALKDLYAPHVAELTRLVPEIDPGMWPNFSELI